MATVRKANRLLRVSDDAVQQYLSKGYDQVDDAGAVVQAGKFSSTDKVAAARVAELEAENAELKARVAELETAKPKK